MASEFRPPTPEEIAAGIFQSGRTPEQFIGMPKIILCISEGLEARRSFLLMNPAFLKQRY